MSMGDEVPDDLATHPVTPATEQTQPQTQLNINMAGEEVPVENQGVAQVQKEPETAFSPAIGGGVGLGVGTVAGMGAAGKNLLLDKFGNSFGPQSLQRYANTQIGNQYNIPLSDLEKEVGFKIQTMPEVQSAVKKISRAEATPETIKPIYGLNEKGEPVITRYERTPGLPASEGINLSKYEKGALHGVKTYGKPLLKGAVAGYDIGRGLADPASIGGAADIAAGTLAAASPWIPEHIGKIPTRAIANFISALPAAKGVYERLTKPEEKAAGGTIENPMMDTASLIRSAADNAMRQYDRPTGQQFDPSPRGIQVGNGYLTGDVSKAPFANSPKVNVAYTLPFAEGGSVSMIDVLMNGSKKAKKAVKKFKKDLE